MKLSGPVSIHILKPTPIFQTSMLKNYGINAPVIMLLGDLHGGSDKMCAEPSHEDEEETEDEDEFGNPIESFTRVYSSQFLRGLDYLAKMYGGDLAVEGFRLGKSTALLPRPKDDEDVEPLTALAVSFPGCFPPVFDNCETKHLRWHYADPRQAEIGAVEEADMNEAVTCYKRIVDSVVAGQKHLNPRDVACSARLYSLVQQDALNLSETRSLILKQIRNSPPALKSNWAKLFQQYINTRIQSDLFTKSAKFQASLIRLLHSGETDAIPELVHKAGHKTAILSTKSKGLIAVSPMLDLYYIARTFKFGQTKPISLSTGYFGFQHCANIAELLAQANGLSQLAYQAGSPAYELVYYSGAPDIKSENLRCISITESVDLEALVRENYAIALAH